MCPFCLLTANRRSVRLNFGRGTGRIPHWKGASQARNEFSRQRTGVSGAGKIQRSADWRDHAASRMPEACQHRRGGVLVPAPDTRAC